MISEKSTRMMMVERIGNLRFLPLDTYPRAIDLAQRPIGKVILLALFALLMTPATGSVPITITIAAGACAFAGRYRARVLAVATMMTAFLQPTWFGWFWPNELTLRKVLAGEATLREVLAGRMDMVFSLGPMLAAFFLFAVFAMYLIRQFREAPITRHPIILTAS